MDTDSGDGLLYRDFGLRKVEIVWTNAKMLEGVMEGFRKGGCMIAIECGGKLPAARPGSSKEL